MNTEEIKGYINGHVEQMVETLVDECEDWYAIQFTRRTSPENRYPTDIILALRARLFDRRVPKDEMDRLSLRMAKKFALEALRRALKSGRRLYLYPSGTNYYLADTDCFWLEIGTK